MHFIGYHRILWIWLLGAALTGANPAAADVICRSMGYDFGSVSSSPCGFYGGADLCGAAGSPVVSCLSMHEECARVFFVFG